MSQRKHGILLGLIMAQLGIATPETLARGARGWLNTPERDLGAMLLEHCGVAPEIGDSLRRILALQLKRHLDDPERCLVTLGGSERVSTAFSGELQWHPADTMLSVEGRDNAAVGGVGDETVPMRHGAFGDGAEGARPAFVRETPGRYQVKSEYGRGGMGRILLAFDESVGREIALKELLAPPNGVGSDASASPKIGSKQSVRFLREARITGQLEHPGIVPVYEIALRDDDSVYYTMKLVRGMTLAQKLRECPNPGARFELLSHFQMICDAVAYAHDRGVIHRDLKPGNIMIGQYGEAVVLDWGLAKVLDGGENVDESLPPIQADSPGSPTDRTAPGTAVGTPVYMSPEQARGDLESIDERSDVWALGCILYEILTGRPPFQGDSVQAVLRGVIAGEPRPVRELELEAPPGLAGVAERCLEKEPARRFRNAGAVAARLHDDIQERQQAAFREEAHQREIALLARPMGNMLLNIGVFGGFGILLSFLLRHSESAFNTPLYRFLLWIPIILGVGGYMLYTVRRLKIPPGFITGPTIGMWSAILAGSVGVEVIAGIIGLPRDRLIGVHSILVGIGISALAFRVQRWFLVVAGLFYGAGIVMTVYPAQSREILGVVLLVGIGGCGFFLRRWSGQRSAS